MASATSFSLNLFHLAGSSCILLYVCLLVRNLFPVTEITCYVGYSNSLNNKSMYRTNIALVSPCKTWCSFIKQNTPAHYSPIWILTRTLALLRRGEDIKTDDLWPVTVTLYVSLLHVLFHLRYWYLLEYTNLF